MKGELSIAKSGEFMNVEMTTVGVCLEGSNNVWTFKVPLDIAANLKKGSLVLCDTRRGIALGTVYNVDKEPRMDVAVDNYIKYKWVFAAVDASVLERLDDLKREDAAYRKRMELLFKQSSR